MNNYNNLNNYYNVSKLPGSTNVSIREKRTKYVVKTISQTGNFAPNVLHNFTEFLTFKLYDKLIPGSVPKVKPITKNNLYCGFREEYINGKTPQKLFQEGNLYGNKLNKLNNEINKFFVLNLIFNNYDAKLAQNYIVPEINGQYKLDEVKIIDLGASMNFRARGGLRNFSNNVFNSESCKILNKNMFIGRARYFSTYLSNKNSLIKYLKQFDFDEFIKNINECFYENRKIISKFVNDYEEIFNQYNYKIKNLDDRLKPEQININYFERLKDKINLRIEKLKELSYP